MSGDLWTVEDSGNISVTGDDDLLFLVPLKPQLRRDLQVAPEPYPLQTLGIDQRAPSPLLDSRGATGRISLARRGCFRVLEIVFLLPLLLCGCVIVLLPSAVHFTPREILVKNVTSGINSYNICDESNRTIEKNCSEGFFSAIVNNTNTCRPSCEDFRLDLDVSGLSLYWIVMIASGTLSCASGLCFMVLALLRKKTK